MKRKKLKIKKVILIGSVNIQLRVYFKTFLVVFYSGGGLNLFFVRGCATQTFESWLSLYLFSKKITTHRYINLSQKAPISSQMRPICRFFEWKLQKYTQADKLGGFTFLERHPTLYQNCWHVPVYHDTGRTRGVARCAVEGGRGWKNVPN